MTHFKLFSQCMFSPVSLSLSLVVHRQDFEKRRKAHYKEFEAVKLARKLIEEEDEGEVEGDQEDDLDSSKIIVVETTDVVLPPELPGSSSMDTSPSAETPVGEPSLV